jgi:hypothetical protein
VLAGREYPLLNHCTVCDGKGTFLAWVDVYQLAMMFHAIAFE